MQSNKLIDDYSQQINQLKDDRKQTRKELTKEYFKVALVLVLFILATVFIINMTIGYLLSGIDIADGGRAANILGMVGVAIFIIFIGISAMLEKRFQSNKKIVSYRQDLKSIDYQINFLDRISKELNEV